MIGRQSLSGSKSLLEICTDTHTAEKKWRFKLSKNVVAVVFFFCRSRQTCNSFPSYSMITSRLRFFAVLCCFVFNWIFCFSSSSDYHLENYYQIAWKKGFILHRIGISMLRVFATYTWENVCVLNCFWYKIYVKYSIMSAEAGSPLSVLIKPNARRGAAHF